MLVCKPFLQIELKVSVVKFYKFKCDIETATVALQLNVPPHIAFIVVKTFERQYLIMYNQNHLHFIYPILEPALFKVSFSMFTVVDLIFFENICVCTEQELQLHFSVLTTSVSCFIIISMSLKSLSISNASCSFDLSPFCIFICFLSRDKAN